MEGAKLAGSRFPEWLDERMTAAGIRSMRVLATRAGVDPIRLADFHMGNDQPRDDECEALARFFGVDIAAVKKARGF